MKIRSLLTSVSLIALPLSLFSVTSARAEDDGCAGMNAVQCQLSRAAYAVTHIGQKEAPAAKLTVVPDAPAVAGPTPDQLSSAATKVNDLALTGVISADQAANALKLIATGAGNLTAKVVSNDGGSVISNDGGSLIASNALAQSGASALKAQINAAMISQDGGGLTGKAAAVQQNIIAGLYDAGKITDLQASALNKLASSGSNVISNDGGSFGLTGVAKSALVGNAGGTLVGNAGGTLVGNAGGTLVGNAGGTLVGNAGGTLVGNAGGTFVGNNGSALITDNGGALVGNAGGTFVGHNGSAVISDNGLGLVAKAGNGALSDAGSGLLKSGNSAISDNGSGLAAVNSLLSEHGASIVSAAGISDRSVLDAGSNKGRKVAALIATVAPPPGPTPAQLAAQQAVVDTQKAATDLINASDLVRRDGIALQNAKAANDQNLVGQFQAKIDTDNKAVLAVGAVLMAKSTLVAPTDVDAVSKLLNSSVAAAKTNVDSGNAAANAAPAKPQPSQLQIDTANAAAATAAVAAKAAADANNGVLALTATLGNRPTNTADLLKVNQAMAASAVDSAKANLTKAQSDLVAMSAKGASAYDIQGQKDLVAKAQTNLTYQTSMVANDYAGKAIVADTAKNDVATARAVVDGLTKAYGSNRPADPQQLATINAAMVVQALAQDKADQALADATAVRLIANGASKSDIQTQTDLSAAKQKDMANILKVNPAIVAAAGVAGNTDPALVSKAISGLVAKAAADTSGAVQLTTAQVQAAQAALQQVKAAGGSTTTPAVTSTSAADVSSMLNTLTKTAASYSIKSLPGDAATPSSTAPAVQVATTSATVPVVGTPAAPAVDKSELTPAVVQMLLQSGPASIQAMQNAQAAALAKGDKAMADGLGKNIANLQAQVAAAKTMPAPTTSTVAAVTPAAGATVVAAAPSNGTSVVSTPATVTAPVVVATPAVSVDKSEFTPAVVQMLQQSGTAAIQAMQTAQAAALAKGDKAMADGLGKDIVNLQAQVAVAKSMPAPTPASLQAPTGTAAVATSTAATVTTPSAVASTPSIVASTPANASVLAPAKQEPTKITSEQGKAVQQSLRTIPGKLNATEEKTFSTLSTLVDRAVTKGLTAEEAVTLKNGLAALADKHPKAEKQHGLTTLANTVAVKPAVAANPAGAGGTELKPTANATPPKTTPGTGAAAISVREAVQEKRPANSAVAVAPVAVAIPVTSAASPSGKPAVSSSEVSREALPRRDKPAEVTAPKPTVASTTPVVRVETPVAKPDLVRTTVPNTPQVHVQEPRPQVTPQVVAPKPPVNIQAMRVEPKPPVAPRPPTPQVAAPRPTIASSTPVAVKPPAAKPQTCAPNMVNGKMMGMTCH